VTGEADRLPGGKLPPELLGALLDALPAAPPDVLVGPRLGEDAAALAVPAGVIVAAADPITLVGEEVGRLAVLVNANDVAVTGARPRWFLAVVLVPPGTTGAAVRMLLAEISGTLAGVGAHLVGGHTEVTDAVTRPVVVGQMLGLTEPGRVVSTAGAAAGSVVVQVGAAPVEAAAVLAREASSRLGALPPHVLEAARRALDDPGPSVVEAALAAAELGATALHDPTEGGLAAGLHELAHASGVAVRVDLDAVLWFGPGVAVCRALGADPWGALASGTLLAAFPSESAATAVAELSARGHTAAAIGAAEPGAGVVDAGGTPVARPPRDEVERVLSSGLGPGWCV
jgi:hydrogenase maturation factor